MILILCSKVKCCSLDPKHPLKGQMIKTLSSACCNWKVVELLRGVASWEAFLPLVMYFEGSLIPASSSLSYLAPWLSSDQLCFTMHSFEHMFPCHCPQDKRADRKWQKLSKAFRLNRSFLFMSRLSWMFVPVMKILVTYKDICSRIPLFIWSYNQIWMVEIFLFALNIILILLVV